MSILLLENTKTQLVLYQPCNFLVTIGNVGAFASYNGVKNNGKVIFAECILFLLCTFFSECVPLAF